MAFASPLPTKRRASIVAFTNAYHGMTLGSLAVTGNDFYRNEYDGVQGNTSFFPFDGYLGPDVDTIDYLRGFISDGGSGVDLPAAIIVEAVQGEGGVNIARPAWLRKLERLCRDFDILLIVDDIQMGNGRTGAFFSFEEAAIRPDMVILSKSIAGGLPMAILLMRPELDRWRPGEHTGTFRGNNLAFVAATELLAYWDDDQLSKSVAYRGEIMDKALQGIATGYPELSMAVRGRGMIWGLEFPQRGLAAKVSRRCFESGLLIETAGTRNQVLKFLPPLIMEEDLLRRGLRIIDDAIAALARG